MIAKREKFCRTGAAKNRNSFHLAYDERANLRRTVGDGMKGLGHWQIRIILASVK